MNSKANITVAKFREFNSRVLPHLICRPHLLQDHEVGKTRCDGASDESRITLLLHGSGSLLQFDRTPGRSPIEKIYESYVEERGWLLRAFSPVV